MADRWNGQTHVGGWELQKRLGQGGNGEVYQASKNGTIAALKIFRPRNWNNKRRHRFNDEVDAMKRCEHLGCVPVVEFDLPARVSERVPAWIAMGMAQTLVDALGSEPPLDAVVACMRDVAHMLADMHDLGIAHRDIKPDNLFMFDGRWTVGDFGLVDFDGKAAETSAHEKVGPTFFIAPEMLNDALRSDGKAADVYSLAKTLWVLVTGQRYPLPGQILASIPALAVSSFVAQPRAALLNPILELATDVDPTKRPKMREFAQELEAWLKPPSPTHDNTELDLTEFAADFGALKYQFEAAQNAENARQSRMHETGARIREKLRPITNEIVRALQAGNFLNVVSQIENVHYGATICATVPQLPGASIWTRLHLEIFVGHRDENNSTVTAEYKVEVTGNQAKKVVGTASCEFISGGSGEDVSLAQLAAEIRRQLRPAVNQAVEIGKSL